MKTQCSHCQARYNVPDTAAGRKGKCPHCGEVFLVAPIAEPSPELYDVAEATKSCPFCGETILSVARKCKHCQQMLNDTNPQVTTTTFVPKTNKTNGSGVSRWVTLPVAGLAVLITAVLLLHVAGPSDRTKQAPHAPKPAGQAGAQAEPKQTPEEAKKAAAEAKYLPGFVASAEPFASAIQSLHSGLKLGLNYQEYRQRVLTLVDAYDRVDTGGKDAVSDIWMMLWCAKPLVEDHKKALELWGLKIEAGEYDYTHYYDSEMQNRWSDATKKSESFLSLFRYMQERVEEMRTSRER